MYNEKEKTKEKRKRKALLGLDFKKKSSSDLIAAIMIYKFMSWLTHLTNNPASILLPWYNLVSHLQYGHGFELKVVFVDGRIHLTLLCIASNDAVDSQDYNDDKDDTCDNNTSN